MSALLLICPAEIALHTAVIRREHSGFLVHLQRLNPFTIAFEGLSQQLVGMDISRVGL